MVQEPDDWMKAVSIRAVADKSSDCANPSRGVRDHPGDANWGRRPVSSIAQMNRLARAIVDGRPMHIDELARRMRPAMEEELKAFRPDVVHVATGALGALGRDLRGFPSVLASLDAEHKNVEAQAHEFTGVRRLLLLGEAARMRRFEAEEYARFSHVIVVSEQDRYALQSANPHMVVNIIPNGVDTAYFVPPASRRLDSTIVFHGLMDFAPNVRAADFLARKVLPLVRRRYQDARLVIVGRSPTNKVRTLANITGVTVTGEVQDIRPWLNNARVHVSPMLSGTGIKTKLLEAMASGMSCVATPLALGGIRATPEREILVAQGSSEIAEQVVRLLANDLLVHKLGEAARRYIEMNHDWRTIARAYETVYEAATQSHTEARA
jgi:glycosyltransferase involved in cell wall biosynthesis